ncbi:MAG: YqzL family protein [Clostridia bacterium]|nr:YqzL family protein [Clostridia bacterium]
MIKKIAWNTFKNTGNINTFLEMVEIQNVEQNLNKNVEAEVYGDNKGKWNNIEGK